MKKILMRIDSHGFFKLCYATLVWFFIILFKKFSKKKLLKRRVFDFKMYLNIYDEGLSKQLIKYGCRELEHKYILNKVVKEGGFILDIGGNIGYYAIMERKLIGDSGKLIVIEPSLENVSLLNKNLLLNGFSEVRVIKGAVSSSSGKKKLFLSYESNLNTFHNYGSAKKHLSGESIEVDTYTVPQLIQESGIERDLDLIRMDVEGHEVAIIEGMIDSIEKKELSPSILFETHISRYNQENDMSKVLNKLFECGYKVSLVGSSWQEGTERIKRLGYKEEVNIPTDGVRRSIFQDLSHKDSIDLICNTGGVRTVLLQHESRIS